MDREASVHDRHVVRTHLRRAALMPIGDRRIANERVVDQPIGAGDALTADDGAESIAATDLPAQLYAGSSRFQIPRIRQHIGIDDRHVAGIG